MDQGTGKLDDPGDSVRVRGARISVSSGTEDLGDVPPEAQEIERTRQHMSETIEQIQERLSPDTSSVTETVDRVMQEAKSTAEEWSELARVAALETVEHAVEEVKSALPTVTEQARELAQETIDHAIQEAKAAVRELGEQARSAVRDATIGKVERVAHQTGQSSKSLGASLMTTIKQNPGPAALTGIGLGWLMMSNKSAGGQTSASTGSQTSGTVSNATGQVKDAAGQAQGKAGEVAGQAQQAAGQAVDQAQAVAGQAVGQAQEVAGQAVDQVQGAASAVTDQAQQAASTVTTQAQQLTSRVRVMLNENPLAVGVVAAAVGSAAALAVPPTQREQQLLGQTRDKVVDRAQVGAQGLLQKVQKVAEEAEEAVEKEAKYQGLTPEK